MAIIDQSQERKDNYERKSLLAIDIAANIDGLRENNPINREVIQQGTEYLSSLQIYTKEVIRTKACHWYDSGDEWETIQNIQELSDIYKEEFRDKTFIPNLIDHTKNLESLLKGQKSPEDNLTKTSIFFKDIGVRYLKAYETMKKNISLTSAPAN